MREGKEYKKESSPKGEDYTTPSREYFTACLDGKYALDEDHYFYFVYCPVNSYYAYSFYQYFSPSLDKPLEGFIAGKTYTNLENVPTLVITRSHGVTITNIDKDSASFMYYGYYKVDSNDRLVPHWGTVDYDNGAVNSFTFEHLARYWTDKEMDEWTKNIDYKLPDPIIYDYLGGTYSKVS